MLHCSFFYREFLGADMGVATIAWGGGGGGAPRIQNFLIRKNLSIQTVGGGGGSQSFGETKKKLFFFPDASPY